MEPIVDIENTQNDNEIMKKIFKMKDSVKSWRKYRKDNFVDCLSETNNINFLNSLIQMTLKIETMEKYPNIELFNFKPRLDKLCGKSENYLFANTYDMKIIINEIYKNILECCIKFIFNNIEKDNTIYNLKLLFEKLCNDMNNIIKDNESLIDQIEVINNIISNYENEMNDNKTKIKPNNFFDNNPTIANYNINGIR